jgi:alpha-tubulin suppressor-like RCC1 family protein
VDQYEPKRLEIPNTEGQKILSIACGLNTSAVVLNGTLYTWGANEMGQLGRGSSNVRVHFFIFFFSFFLFND